MLVDLQMSKRAISLSSIFEWHYWSRDNWIDLQNYQRSNVINRWCRSKRHNISRYHVRRNDHEAYAQDFQIQNKRQHLFEKNISRHVIGIFRLFFLDRRRHEQQKSIRLRDCQHVHEYIDDATLQTRYCERNHQHRRHHEQWLYYEKIESTTTNIFTKNEQHLIEWARFLDHFREKRIRESIEFDENDKNNDAIAIVVVVVEKWKNELNIECAISAFD